MFAHCGQVFQSVGLLADVCGGGDAAGPGNADSLMGRMLAKQQFFHRPDIFPELIQCFFASGVILSFAGFACFIVGIMVTDIIDEIDIAGAEQVA